MLRTVTPHDLTAICASCGRTLHDLFEETGIPEAELAAFANGNHALSANDRFGIIATVNQWLTGHRLPCERPNRRTFGNTAQPLRDLVFEVEEEESQDSSDSQ